MQIDVLTEEQSAKAALDLLLPKILPQTVTFRVSNFNGKSDLMKKLPDRLRAYARRIRREELRICVLVDEDRQDCRLLKRRLEEVAKQAGLVTKSVSVGRTFNLLNRIAVEELEAWFFGDPDAMRCAYPLLSRNFEKSATYRRPDDIKGGTAEALERLLRRHRYVMGNLPKVQVARNIAEWMDPSKNCSPSFCQFRDGILAMTA